MQRLRPPRLREEPLEPVTLDAVRAMLSTCKGKTLLDYRDASLLMTLLDTGARAQELLAVNIVDVDVGNGTLMLRKTKGKRPRVVFLGTMTRKAMLRYLRLRGITAEDSPLWLTSRGNRLSYWGLRQILRRRAEKAGVKPSSAHAFRRAFCLSMLRGGADLISVQRLAGHADIDTTRRYLKQVADDLQKAHKKSSPVDNML
jgi:integrase/recombinase XerD